jgi:hypothetical protein
MSNKAEIVSPEGFEAVILQNKRLALTSLTYVVLCLMLNSSMTSVSLQARPADQ